MKKYFALLILSLCVVLPAAGFCDDPHYSVIEIENRTPEFTVSASVQALGSPVAAFSQTAVANVYEYKFPVSEDAWFNTVDVDVLWEKAYLDNDGKPQNFDQHIVLRIRHDFPTHFSIPVYFSNDRSQNEMSRLEREQDINQQFEVFFRGQQIAAYYRDTFSSQHPFTVRAAKIFFYGAVKLAEAPGNVVIMSDDARQFIEEALGGSSAYLARANVAGSVYWYDLRQIDTYASKGDCHTANMILDSFKALKSDDPKSFDLRYGKDPAVLDEKAAIVHLSCDSVNVAQPLRGR